MLEIFSAAGVRLASHRLAPDGAGTLVRSAGHRAELERVVLSAFTTARPCERKGNHPPGDTARAEAARLLAGLGPDVTVDLARYAELAGLAGDPVSEASIYQQLRGHLAELRLTAAAEALPAELDHASATPASATPRSSNGSSPSRSPPPRPAGRPAWPASRACPRPGSSPTSTSTPSPRSTASSSPSWAPCGSSTTPPTCC